MQRNCRGQKWKWARGRMRSLVYKRKTKECGSPAPFPDFSCCIVTVNFSQNVHNSNFNDLIYSCRLMNHFESNWYPNCVPHYDSHYTLLSTPRTQIQRQNAKKIKQLGKMEVNNSAQTEEVARNSYFHRFCVLIYRRAGGHNKSRAHMRIYMCTSYNCIKWW